ncbi:MAG: DUF2029 domain-containing protein [Gemmatimonadales bacterium]|nr:DUF2029 domain-containing protein [Gemmatimonadales bacterium]
MSLPRADALTQLRAWWNRAGPGALTAACAVLAVLALLKLGTEFYRLLLDAGPTGAIDLIFRFEETHRWFSGQPVYTELHRITYPPAAYPFLWPILGWLALPPARWLFGLTAVLMLAWLARLLVKASGASTRTERLLVVLVVLSLNSVGVAIGNGQLVLHLLPPTLTALFLLHDSRVGWGRDWSIAGLLLVALVKPTLTLPFVWMAFLSSRRFRPFLLTGVLYAVVTLFASRFQHDAPMNLIRQWLAQSAEYLDGGYGDIQSGLLSLGKPAWVQPAALLVLLAAGLWAYRYRSAGLWIQIGFGALVARMWTYHRVYDDALILLPLVALFRMAKEGRPKGADVIAALLFALGVVAMLAPARLETAPPPLSWLFVWGHVAVWLAMLAYFWWAARAPTIQRS